MNAVKFTFDRSFDKADRQQAAGETRSRKSYTAAEIEDIKATSFEEGRRAGEVRAAEGIAMGLAEVANALGRAIAKMNGEIDAMRGEAAQLALAAARQLAGAALAHAPDAEIAEALRVALHQAMSETHITIKVSPGLLGGLEQKLSEVAHHEAYEGRLRFVPDTSLNFGDCRIEWRGGGIELAQSRIEQALSELIARRFPPQDGE